MCILFVLNFKFSFFINLNRSNNAKRGTCKNLAKNLFDHLDSNVFILRLFKLLETKI